MATSKPTKRVEAFTHEESRLNIPTEELSAFVQNDEETPATMLYPRDPSLDPQLVWKGKDEQDREDLAVPVVPIYIQEKIHPQAIMADIQSRSSSAGIGEAAVAYDQMNFFADFNGISNFEDRIDFYQHEQHWSNRMILGDSLYVMTSLAEKEGLKGKVQTIYFDPPYGIKFGSNWQVSTRKRDVKDGSASDATRQPEQVRAFRDTWKLGIHSYLSYLRDRLTVARDLLTESGSIFLQISDENVHLVRCVLDEVFGSENQCATIAWQKATPDSSTIRNAFNYLLWYMKDILIGPSKVRKLFDERTGDEGSTEDPRKLALWGEFPEGERRLTTSEKRNILATRENARVFRVDKVIESGSDPERKFAFNFDGSDYFPASGQVWRGKDFQMERLLNAKRIIKTDEGFGFRFYIDDFPVVEMTNLWRDTGGNIKDMRYVVETNPKIIERCILMTTDPGDLVLDPTCGSGTTAYVAEQWGRRWITIDTSRVALALARTRLMAGRFPYYLLADSEAGRRKERELYPLTQPLPSAEGQGESSLSPSQRGEGRGEGSASLPRARGRAGEGDIRKGFVYKRVPHVTLKSIANNPDIKEGMTREEIDAAIARHADSETLFDQPYEDSKVVRVTGPFTVESLSPHRVLDPLPPAPSPFAKGEGETSLSPSQRGEGSDFATMILDNLRKAGVQNTYKGERIVFDRLDAFPGKAIAARGEFTDASGEVKRVAVTIGPEHGTVGSEQIREAAKEAMKGLGTDVLLVCGFAFDGSVSEEAKQYGALTVLPTRMNPDLTMDELLKKTGTGNLFMVFGEPDVVITPTGDKLVVEIHGLDVYDPTTGEVRSNSTDDIACWFIDTNYNEESFFVRHAYFTGADEPYDKLKRALKAEVDEAAWASLYSTVSYPFERPETGKIAVKVINHFGDEVLKVYEV